MLVVILVNTKCIWKVQLLDEHLALHTKAKINYILVLTHSDKKRHASTATSTDPSRKLVTGSLRLASKEWTSKSQCLSDEAKLKGKTLKNKTVVKVKSFKEKKESPTRKSKFLLWAFLRGSLKVLKFSSILTTLGHRWVVWGLFIIKKSDEVDDYIVHVIDLTWKLRLLAWASFWLRTVGVCLQPSTFKAKSNFSSFSELAYSWILLSRNFCVNG